MSICYLEAILDGVKPLSQVQASQIGSVLLVPVPTLWHAQIAQRLEQLLLALVGGRQVLAKGQ